MDDMPKIPPKRLFFARFEQLKHLRALEEEYQVSLQLPPGCTKRVLRCASRKRPVKILPKARFVRMVQCVKIEFCVIAAPSTVGEEHCQGLLEVSWGWVLKCGCGASRKLVPRCIFTDPDIVRWLKTPSATTHDDKND